MKKVFLLMMAAMTAIALVGCGKKEEAAIEPTAITETKPADAATTEAPAADATAPDATAPEAATDAAGTNTEPVATSEAVALNPEIPAGFDKSLLMEETIMHATEQDVNGQKVIAVIYETAKSVDDVKAFYKAAAEKAGLSTVVMDQDVEGAWMLTVTSADSKKQMAVVTAPGADGKVLVTVSAN